MPSKNFGKRPDGTDKGSGFLGLLPRPDGGVSSELSVGIEIDGKKMLIPTLIPGLTKKEKDFLLSLEEGDAKSIPESIMKKATDHALKRDKEGRGPFIEDDETQQGPPTQAQKPTGSLLQDVTIPQTKDMDVAVDLFLGGQQQAAPAGDPSGTEVNKFLNGN